MSCRRCRRQTRKGNAGRDSVRRDNRSVERPRSNIASFDTGYESTGIGHIVASVIPSRDTLRRQPYRRDGARRLSSSLPARTKVHSDAHIMIKVDLNPPVPVQDVSPSCRLVRSYFDAVVVMFLIFSYEYHIYTYVHTPRAKTHHNVPTSTSRYRYPS